MKTNFIVIVCIFFGSCTSKELKIQDLKFNNSEKQWIEANKIQSSIISYDSSCFEKPLNKRFVSFCVEGIGTVLIEYDSNGNIIRHKIREYGGTTQNFEFDSLQLLRRKIHTTDFSAIYSVSYLFANKQQRLYQFWTYGNEIDTSVFTFNSLGFVLNEKGRMHDDKSRDRTFDKDYLYKNDTLYKIITSFTNNYKHLTKTEETLFYKNGKINKIEILYLYSSIDKIYPLILKLVKEFDNNGLPIRCIETYSNLNKNIIKVIENK